VLIPIRPVVVLGFLISLIGTAGRLSSQQVADTAFRPRIDKPAYLLDQGPVVLIDEAHNNFHTASGRYLPFAELLRRDGYIVRPSAVPLTAAVLQTASVLVIANAQAAENSPAFTAAEVEVVRNWVVDGGSLLLIGDHPPFTAGALQLGVPLGIRFRNAGAVPRNSQTGRIVFQKTNGTLVQHIITAGIDHVATFTGSSFELTGPGEPLLTFGPDVLSYAQPEDPNPLSATGHLQGAVLRVGQGRVAVFAEAAMFSAQVTGPNRSPMGMNAEIAEFNAQFLLNVMHWLTRVP
jgi:hypothetical protein